MNDRSVTQTLRASEINRTHLAQLMKTLLLEINKHIIRVIPLNLVNPIESMMLYHLTVLISMLDGVSSQRLLQQTACCRINTCENTTCYMLSNSLVQTVRMMLSLKLVMIAHLGFHKKTTQYAERYGVTEHSLILDVDFRKRAADCYSKYCLLFEC